MFEKQKQERLSRADYSKKGSIDSRIASLVEEINNKEEYYTTSSCSGRIIIYSEGKNKKEARWILVSHDEISQQDVKNAVQKSGEKLLWFKFEPLIMHVACDSLESAQNLVNCARQAGFKKSGIIEIRKFIVEIRGIDIISSPLNPDIDDSYLGLLVREANNKMKKNHLRINKFKF